MSEKLSNYNERHPMWQLSEMIDELKKRRLEFGNKYELIKNELNKNPSLDRAVSKPELEVALGRIKQAIDEIDEKMIEASERLEDLLKKMEMYN